MPGGGGYVSPTIWSPPRLSASEELTTEQLVRAHGTFPTGASLLRTVLAHIRVPRLPCPAWPCQAATLKAFEATLDRGAPPLVPTRAFGRVDAGVRLPIISLGAWQFGHQAQLNSKRPMLGPITEQKTAPSTLSHPLPTLSPPLAPPRRRCCAHPSGSARAGQQLRCQHHRCRGLHRSRVSPVQPERVALASCGCQCDRWNLRSVWVRVMRCRSV